MCTHLLFIVLFWKLKEIWLDLTDTQKRTLTQYSVNNERIRELVLNGGHGSWLTYLPIRLCFLKPQLFFSVLKASQSDKPPLLPPSGWMMLLSRQPWDKPPPPDTLPLFFLVEWCHSRHGDRQRRQQDTIMQTRSLIWTFGEMGVWRGLWLVVGLIKRSWVPEHRGSPSLRADRTAREDKRCRETSSGGQNFLLRSKLTTVPDCEFIWTIEHQLREHFLLLW